MKIHRILFIVLMIMSFVSSAALAGDFEWLQNLNIRAEADPSGFRAELAARFRIGNAEINAVMSNMERPADAYMVLRLGEMSHQPPEYVVRQYRSGKGKGWGALAKSLGIKPGSKEFHALKSGHDLHGGGDIIIVGKSKGKGHGKGNGKGKK